MKFSLKSPSFYQNEEIPKQFTGEGNDQTPALEWENEPGATKEFALICEGTDAPKDEAWVHWVLYKIPAILKKLPEAIPPTERLDLPPGLFQGKNSFGSVGYGGPMPPPGLGWHHYHFTLYALDCELNAKPGLSKDELAKAMVGHVLATAELIGRYKRDEEIGKMGKTG